LIPSCFFLDASGIHGQTRTGRSPLKSAGPIQSSSPKLLAKLANATIKCAKLGVTRVPFASFVNSSGQSAGRLIMLLQLLRRLIKSDSSTLSPSPISRCIWDIRVYHRAEQRTGESFGGSPSKLDGILFKTKSRDTRGIGGKEKQG
jgi:hypothetical protein